MFVVFLEDSESVFLCPDNSELFVGEMGVALGLTICGCGRPDNSEIGFGKWGGGALGLTICGCGCPTIKKFVLGNGGGHWG